MLISRYSFTPVASAVLGLWIPFSHAQTSVAADSNVPTLETVTVNASADASAEGLTKPFAGGQVARGGRVGILGNQDILETPFSSTNYTSELIQDQQARSIGDVLQNDPSVRLSRGYGNYQQLYVVRGFPLYSDDISYNGLYGLVPRQYMLTEFIERVEVLRGANSFINGAAPGGSGVGGSINLLPKRAGGEPTSRVSFGTGTDGQNFVSTDLGRRFGPDQSTGLRLNAITGSGGTGVDNEKSKATGLSVGLDWHSSTVRLSADLGYQERNLNQPRPSVTIGAGLPVPAAPSASSNFAQTWTNSNSKDTFATVRGEVDLSPQVTAWAAIGMREGNEKNVLTDPVTTTSTHGATTQFRFDNGRKDSVTTAEAGVRGKFDTFGVKHTVSASATTFEQKSRNAYQFSDSFASNIYTPAPIAAPAYSALSTGGGSLSNPLLTNKMNSSSLALADTMAFAEDHVLLTLGVRYQSIKQQNYDYLGPATTRNNDSRTSPLAAVVFKANKNLSFYANYAEGLVKGDNAPQFNFVPFYPIANANQALSTYVSKQKELGVKYDAGMFGASAAFFTTIQPTAFVNPMTQTYGRYGEQRNEGVELSVFGEPTKGLRLLGGVTFLDAKQISSPSGATDGRDAIGVPGQQWNIGGDWDVPGMRGFAMNARLLNTSKQYADSANAQAVPSWTRMDIGARYLTEVAGKLLTLRGRIDNVANKSYWASAGGYPGQGYLVLGAPRTFSLTASVEF